MTFKNAQQTRVIVGATNYSAYATQATIKSDIAMLRTTTLIDTAEQYIPGMDGSDLALDLLIDSSGAAGGEFAHATAWKSAASQPITYAPAGLSTGSECFMVRGLETAFNQTSAAAAVVVGQLTALTDGYTDIGTMVEDLTAITIDTTGTARNGIAASSNGGIAHLHVTAFSGLTSNVVTIEHSVNGSTGWSTLVTFATVTGLTSEAVVVAPGTTVRQYLRVVDDVTGTGTTTRAVAFARR